jgi:hypothetical protein
MQAREIQVPTIQAQDFSKDKNKNLLNGNKVHNIHTVLRHVPFRRTVLAAAPFLEHQRHQQFQWQNQPPDRRGLRPTRRRVERTLGKEKSRLSLNQVISWLSGIQWVGNELVFDINTETTSP